MVDYYHINLDKIKLFEFDGNPSKLSTEQQVEFNKQLKDIMKTVVSTFQVRHQIENKSFKEGLRNMFDRKRRF